MNEGYLIHAHFRDSNTIDAYWVFPTEADALTFYREYVAKCLDFLDVDVYKDEWDEEHDGAFDLDTVKRELLETQYPGYVLYEDGDYLVFTSINDGFARSP